MSHPSPTPPSPNAALLDAIEQASLWFRAKKTRPIFVKVLEKPARVVTLEGEEEVPAGMCLCRGEAGDVWPQKPERVAAKYAATDELTPDGFRKHVPAPDAEGVLAARIEHAFQVVAAWGTLVGKPGDYAVKDYAHRDVRYPADVWIVDAKLFDATYQRMS